MDLPDNNPFVIAFRMFVHCEPVHNYIINHINNMITYYCGNNNTISIPLNYVETVVDKCH